MSKHSSRGSLGAGPVKERVWGERGMKSRRMLCCLCCWGDAESIDHVILRGLWPSTRWPDMLCICRVFLYASWNYTVCEFISWQRMEVEGTVWRGPGAVDIKWCLVCGKEVQKNRFLACLIKLWRGPYANCGCFFPFETSFHVWQELTSLL